MMKQTPRIAVVVATLLLGSATAPAFAQRGGRGGGFGGGQGTTGGGWGTAQGAGHGGFGGGRGAGRGLQGSAPQGSQLRACDGSAEQARDRARDLAHAAQRGSFDAATARTQRDRIHRQVDGMLAGYEQFRGSLASDLAARLGDRQRDLDRARDHLREHLTSLDAAVDAANPDRSRVAEQAREVARATREWQRQMRGIAGEAGA